MESKIFLFIFFTSFIYTSCKKECGVKHDKTARKLMKGTWEITKVITDSISLANTGEKFRFYNYESYQGEGIFTTTDGKDEDFVWYLKADHFGIFPGDTSLVLNKYNSHMQFVHKCTRNEFVFHGPTITGINLFITLKRIKK